MFNALAYVRDNGILNTNDYKEYSAKRGTCTNKTGPYKISSHTKISNCNDLANSLVGRPVSVAVDATNWSTYKSGIFSNCEAQLNHGVLLTGSTDDYWMIKNSWNTKWGIEGYIKLSRGNTCGICNSAVYPNA
jgi:C1A family cysteine protease